MLLPEESNMAESEDKIMMCRQCGKEFHFTVAEQEFYMQQGWTEPGHCPQCRSDRRRRGLHLACSGCGILLGKEEPVYCSNCVENLKLEAELKLHEQEETIKELDDKLKSLGELKQRLNSVTMELEKAQQANRELEDRLAIPPEVAPCDGLIGPLQKLNEEFGAFEQSYSCDIDKLTGLLLEIQDDLIKQRDAGLWHRIRMALTRKTGRHEEASGKGNNPNGHSTQGCPESMPLPENKDTTET